MVMVKQKKTEKQKLKKKGKQVIILLAPIIKDHCEIFSDIGVGSTV